MPATMRSWSQQGVICEKLSFCNCRAWCLTYISWSREQLRSCVTTCLRTKACRAGLDKRRPCMLTLILTCYFPCYSKQSDLVLRLRVFSYWLIKGYWVTDSSIHTIIYPFQKYIKSGSLVLPLHKLMKGYSVLESLIICTILDPLQQT